MLNQLKIQIHNRFLWYVYQLLPLRWDGVYRTNKGKERCTWRMWMGRCYNVNWQPVD